jgi:hypothetical protein
LLFALGLGVGLVLGLGLEANRVGL